MNPLRDIAAFQGTGMVAQPTNYYSPEIAREEKLKVLEYRIAEILYDGGFSDVQTRQITAAVMSNIRSGLSASRENILARLKEAGFTEEIAQSISDNIAVGQGR